MDKKEIDQTVNRVIATYDPAVPMATADCLRDYWLQFEPKSVGGIKAERRARQETVGIPIPILKEIGKTVSKFARKQVDDFLPLTLLLWDDYGREGRAVSSVVLGTMVLQQPQKVVPLLKTLCSSCITWEDCDRLAMDALEPIVRKKPEMWLSELAFWLADDNLWIRRAGVTVAGRLPMKHPGYTRRCLALAETRLFDPETEVRRAVSFAIRISARGSVEAVIDFLSRRVPPENPAATWVLCDVIRSMSKKLLPAFNPVLPQYEAWAADPKLEPAARRSVESAVTALHKALS
jgi:3-methyladenine DNA glycosylase AlkD